VQGTQSFAVKNLAAVGHKLRRYGEHAQLRVLSY
jgi:hypothetical protein